MRIDFNKLIKKIKISEYRRLIKNYKILIIFLIITILIIIISVSTNILNSEYQIFISFAIGLVGSFFANFIYKYFMGKEETEPKIKVKPPLIKKIIDYLHLNSNINDNRKNQILVWSSKYIPLLIEKRKNHLEERKEKQRSENNFLNYPAWHSLSNTYSETGYRLTMGFRNKGCEYWHKNPNKIGCFHCGYASSTIQDERLVKEVNRDNLMQQFYHSLNWADKTNVPYDVIEFLNDGSFFNYDYEFPPEFHKALFEALKKLIHVKRVLIETRPEHITEKKIKGLLSLLRDDQKLEIGIGLETTDEFICKVCINKGYGIKEFEEVLQVVSNFKERCDLVAYIIIKPPFLNENEAIEDTILTIKYLSEMSDKYGTKIIAKLEPAVIAAGTMMDILHFDISHNNKEWYYPLSNWSIVEIISRAYELKLSSNIRIGAREDMDIIEKVPAIYNHDGTFNQYDFWVYDAIQKFNLDKDFKRLLADIQVVVEEDYDSFSRWEKKIHKSMIPYYLNLFEEEIKEIRNEENQKRREIFLHNLFVVLDKIELKKDFHLFAKKLKKEQKTERKIIQNKIEIKINEKVKEVMPGFYEAKVNAHFFEKDKPQMLRVYFQLRNAAERSSHDIWVGIPTQH